jgi:hypothetical protein
MVFYCPVRADSSPARRSLATGRLTRRGALTGFAGLAIAATGLGVAGCTSTKPPPTDAEVLARDPLGPMYAETKQLIEQYDGAMAAAPALAGVLGPLREEHRQHLIALASLINIPAPTISATANASGVPLPSGPGSTPPVHPTPSGTSPQGPSSVGPTGAGQTTGPPASAPGSGSGSASDATATRAALSAAESTAQRNAVAACLSAPTNRVAVLASIAACLATHVAALR